MAPTKNFIIIESTTAPTSGDTGQDWVTDSGDPENITLSNFTTPNDYIEYDCLGWAPVPKPGTKVNQMGTGRAYAAKYGKWKPQVSFRLRLDADLDVPAISRFVYLHCKPGANQLYLCVKGKDGDWVPFYDPLNDVNRDYMPVEILKLDPKISFDRRYWDVEGLVEGVWR